MNHTDKKDHSSLIWGIVIFVLIGCWLLSDTSNTSSNDAVTDKDNTTIDQTIPSPESTPVLRFNGYTCTVDCSGHEAGYDWAERKGIDDVSDCGGNSNSFIEGCESFVEENDPDNIDY